MHEHYLCHGFLQRPLSQSVHTLSPQLSSVSRSTIQVPSASGLLHALSRPGISSQARSPILEVSSKRCASQALAAAITISITV